MSTYRRTKSHVVCGDTVRNVFSYTVASMQVLVFSYGRQNKHLEALRIENINNNEQQCKSMNRKQSEGRTFVIDDQLECSHLMCHIQQPPSHIDYFLLLRKWNGLLTTQKNKNESGKRYQKNQFYKALVLELFIFIVTTIATEFHVCAQKLRTTNDYIN